MIIKNINFNTIMGKNKNNILKIISYCTSFPNRFMREEPQNVNQLASKISKEFTVTKKEIKEYIPSIDENFEPEKKDYTFMYVEDQILLSVEGLDLKIDPFKDTKFELRFFNLDGAQLNIVFRFSIDEIDHKIKHAFVCIDNVIFFDKYCELQERPMIMNYYKIIDILTKEIESL